ncbi:MAG: nitrilase-related carbon-nitrogen hydrolase [Halanaerobiales bacterium]
MLDRIKNRLFKLYLNYKYRPGKLKRYIRKKSKFKGISLKKSIIEEEYLAESPGTTGVEDHFDFGDESSSVRVAAIQVKMELYNEPLRFADKMEELVLDACREGAELLVFPEDNLIQLLGLLPGIEANSNNREKYERREYGEESREELKEEQNRNKQNEIREKENLENGRTDIDELLSGLGEDITVADILVFIGPIIRKITLAIFSELSLKYNVYIMAGSGLFPEEITNHRRNSSTNYCRKSSNNSSNKFNRNSSKSNNSKSNNSKKNNLNKSNAVYNTAYLFGPDGCLLGRQKKNHLLPMEEDWGLYTGEELVVLSTGIGRLAFPVCMDATYFETFQIAYQKNADIVMIPIANPDPDYNYWTALRGIWGRVQESPVYGIKSAMVGNFLGFKLTGQSGVYGPIPLTANKDGIIAESAYHDREDIITAELDLDLLRKYRANRVIDENRDFKERNFPSIYNRLS